MGTLQPVSAFARLTITIDMDKTVKDCEDAASAMKPWRTILTGDTWAQSYMEENENNKQVYENTRHRLKLACTNLAAWDEPANFFRPATGHDMEDFLRQRAGETDNNKRHRREADLMDLYQSSHTSDPILATFFAGAMAGLPVNRTEPFDPVAAAQVDLPPPPPRFSPEERAARRREEQRLTQAHPQLVQFATLEPALDTTHAGTESRSIQDDRHRRAIAAGAIVVALIGGAALMATLTSMLFGGSQPAWSQVVKPTAKLASGAEINAKALESLANSLNDAWYYDHFYTILNAMRGHAAAVTNLVYHIHEAFYELQQGNVSPLFATEQEITNALAEVDKKAAERRMHLSVRTVADVLLLPAFGVKQPGKLTIIIPLPIATDEMFLHRFAGTPLPVLNEGNMTLVVPQPIYTAIAASPKSSDHALVNTADLDSCFKVKQTYMCAELPIRYDREESCLGALFTANADAIQQMCVLAPHPEKWHVAHTRSGTYIVSTTQSFTATTTCPGGHSSTAAIAPGITQITVPPACHTQTPYFGLSTPLTEFASVEVHKQLSWDTHAPLTGDGTQFRLQFRSVASHAAAAAREIRIAKDELQSISGSPWWHHALGPAAVLAIVAIIALYVYKNYARVYTRIATLAPALLGAPAPQQQPEGPIYKPAGAAFQNNAAGPSIHVF